MSFAILSMGLFSVGYAFINFEDVSRHSVQPSIRTLTAEQPFSIIDVSTLCNHMRDERLI